MANLRDTIGRILGKPPYEVTTDEMADKENIDKAVPIMQEERMKNWTPEGRATFGIEAISPRGQLQRDENNAEGKSKTPLMDRLNEAKKNPSGGSENKG
jgi:hypothetical protein